jgi:hypothetical protein
MATALSRRFTLLDAMLLVVAAAVGLTLARVTLPDQTSIKTPPTPVAPAYPAGVHSLPALIKLREILGSAVTASATVSPSIMAFTIAVLFLRFRKPRPRSRLIFRHPGAMGCSAAFLALLIAILALTPTTLQSLGKPNFHGWMFNVWLIISRGAGMAVAGAWLTLAMSGQWRAAGDWIERMGQVLSVAWMLALLLEIALAWSSFFF